jgi:hypothetical protein
VCIGLWIESQAPSSLHRLCIGLLLKSRKHVRTAAASPCRSRDMLVKKSAMPWATACVAARQNEQKAHSTNTTTSAGAPPGFFMRAIHDHTHMHAMPACACSSALAVRHLYTHVTCTGEPGKGGPSQTQTLHTYLHGSGEQMPTVGANRLMGLMPACLQTTLPFASAAAGGSPSSRTSCAPTCSGGRRMLLLLPGRMSIL